MTKYFVLFLPLVLLGIQTQSVFFIAPDGSAEGDGTEGDPWDIVTAFSHPSSVSPGSTLLLRGGEYMIEEELVSSLQGQASNPITVKQYPGERATIDCKVLSEKQPGADCLVLESSHVWYWGFEITNSTLVRWVDETGSASNPRGRGINSKAGPGTKLINLIVHDVGTSIFESQPSGIEINGLIVYNSGWDAPDRPHGHGLYIRNKADWPAKLIKNNFIFHHYQLALHGFGSSGNPFNNFIFKNNVFFNNGISSEGFAANTLYGNSDYDHTNNLFNSNFSYISPEEGVSSTASNQFGYTGGCDEITLTDNVFMNGPLNRSSLFIRCDNPIIEGNILQGKTRLRNNNQIINREEFRTAFPNNTYYSDVGMPDPSGVWVYDFPNEYEPKKVHIVVYNWEGADEIEFDAGGYLETGDSFVVRNVQNYFGEPVVSGVYCNSISIPLTNLEIAHPIGYMIPEDRLTKEEFNVFILEKM